MKTMTISFSSHIAHELQLPERQVAATIELLDSGATIPFISRYRKERTGGLDEVRITDIVNRLAKLRELDARKASILAAIEKKQMLTPELKARIEASWDSHEIEDLYLPFKSKQTKRSETAESSASSSVCRAVSTSR